MARLSWLPEVLRGAGLKVAEHPGWVQRGAEMGEVKGVICHHTGTPDPRRRIMPTLNMLADGVVQANGKRLPGPLAQLGLGRDGTFFVVAAGRCNHAGTGAWKGLPTGNTNFIGIEAENEGKSADVWPEVQIDAYRRGVAAILKHVGASAEMCCAHREWALPEGRKDDPHSIDMDDFRRRVAGLMTGNGVITNPVVPARDTAGRPTLRRGARGEAVEIVQAAVGVTPDGVFGPMTEAAVRNFQRHHGLVPDGIVGPKSWALMPGAENAPTGPLARVPLSTPEASRSRLAWGNKVSPAFRTRVFEICDELGMQPDDLMACMAFETGQSFKANQFNAAGSHAVGLIQFMPSTAGALGTSTAELAAMTAEDQLEFVRKYFEPRKGKLKNLGDIYMAILWPAGIGKPDNHPLFKKDDKPARLYLQNKGLDINKDGVVTRAEACAKVQAMLEKGREASNLFVLS